eukprot:182462-Pleurochrysis_carterae.AAC.1
MSEHRSASGLQSNKAAAAHVSGPDFLMRSILNTLQRVSRMTRPGKHVKDQTPPLWRALSDLHAITYMTSSGRLHLEIMTIRQVALHCSRATKTPWSNSLVSCTETTQEPAALRDRSSGGAQRERCAVMGFCRFVLNSAYSTKSMYSRVHIGGSVQVLSDRNGPPLSIALLLKTTCCCSH